MDFTLYNRINKDLYNFIKQSEIVYVWRRMTYIVLKLGHFLFFAAIFFRCNLKLRSSMC